MPSHAEPPDTQLITALREFASAPGKYHVTLRQPALLFESVREILQLASGKMPATWSSTAKESAAVRRTACFFVRTALLFPGADHYALLGLQREFDAAELKDRYRLLMRLIHPDFAGAGTSAWPSDAAVRVNLAYEVLSSAVQRGEYEERLKATANLPATSAKLERRHPALPARASTGDKQRSRLKQLAVVCSVAAGCVLLISLLAGGPDAVDLVQRAHPPTIAATVASVQERAAPVAPQPSARVAPLPERNTAIQPPPKPPAPALLPRLDVQAAVPAPRVPPAASLGTPAPAPAPPPAAVIAASVAAPIATPPPVRVAPIEAPPAPPPVAAVQLPAPPPPRPPAKPAPVLAEAQPLLANLLQQLESGQGERLINLLERDARNKPAAQALLRDYDGVVGGMRPVRLSQVQLKAEPGDGRLVVKGHVRLHVGEPSTGPGKRMALQVEFASRDGAVVMTGLSGAADN